MTAPARRTPEGGYIGAPIPRREDARLLTGRGTFVDDLEIPGWPYSFGRLIDAQAAGDFAAIESHELPILRVDLGADPAAGLAILERALAAALSQAPEA